MGSSKSRRGLASDQLLAADTPKGEGRQILLTYLCSAVFFFLQCLTSASTAKVMAMFALIAAIIMLFVGWKRICQYMEPVLGMLALVVIMDGISSLYAISGKFALFELLKIVISFCLVILMIALSRGEGEAPGRRLAMLLEGTTALGALVSIDLLSTHLLSGAVLGILNSITPDYLEMTVVEDGVRMTSIFTNPNIFAGCVGIGVLLSLGLALSTEKAAKGERAMHLVCLYINSLGFMLAFSMGASAMIMLAFIVYLILEPGPKRAGLLLLMVETLVLTIAAAGIISQTSFAAWQGMQPIPLVCVIVGAALLWVLDNFIGQGLAERLVTHSKLVAGLACGFVAVILLFAVLGYNLTGSAFLPAGESLRRAAYPEPGEYTIETNIGATTEQPEISLLIESQDREQTMMHTSTILFSGPLDEAAGKQPVIVPEGSLVVYATVTAGEDIELRKMALLTADGAEVPFPLGYKLLPGFVANRLQGLFANENAIQRLVFFEDGIKLFQRSPLYGLGVGAYENGIKSVQSFFYETKYAHNHYIQTMVETGVIGLVLFVGLLAVAAATVLLARYRRENRQTMHPLTPALGATLVFMADHAMTEVVFSTYPYLPLAYGVFALIALCCPGVLSVPRLSEKVQRGMAFCLAALLLCFGVLLGGNLAAARMLAQDPTFETLAKGAALDKYEWADYMLSYVRSSIMGEVRPQIREQADKYAERLGKMNSNTVPLYLAEYYFATNRMETGFEMLHKYVTYVSSDQGAWADAFLLLQNYEVDTPAFRAGAADIVQLLDDWNEANMGEISLDEAAAAFADRMRK